MENVLNISPGLIFWTLVNFSIFFFLLLKFGWKPMRESLQMREKSIQDAIANAEAANKESQRILKESSEKLANAQAEMMNIIKEGRTQAERLVAKAAEEAEKQKVQKIEEARKEMDRAKEEAFAQLRAEVASLVMQATEKVLDTKLDAEAHKGLIASSIAQVSKN
jgi:F-type H+-transporting ATPase subunit b